MVGVNGEGLFGIRHGARTSLKRPSRVAVSAKCDLELTAHDTHCAVALRSTDRRT